MSKAQWLRGSAFQLACRRAPHAEFPNSCMSRMSLVHQLGALGRPFLLFIILEFDPLLIMTAMYT